MMKRLAIFLAALLAAVSCVEKTDDIFSTVTLNTVLSDGEVPVSIKIDSRQDGNFFQNINTGEDYEYPLFVNGSCTMRVQKGVYILGFDGTATMADGTQKTVRCSEHRSPNSSVNLIEDTEVLELNLIAR